MVVAGGTDLFPNMKRRQFEPAVLVGLRGIRELAGEAEGRWLWLVLRPASAVLMLRTPWTFCPADGIGPALLAVPFGPVLPE